MSKKQAPAPSSKRQAVRDQRARRQRQQRLTTILIVAGAALVVAALLILPSIRAALTPVGEIVTITPESRPQAQDNAMGDPNAPVKIEEFSDYQCPFCKNFADETEQQIVDAYVSTGQVYFVYRSMGNFVSDNIQRGGTESRNAAEAAYCAGAQNKYWEYHDMLFANWQGEDVGSFTEKRLMAFAEELGLDMNQFRSCYDSGQFRDRAQQDAVAGRQAGVQGTPAFVINGKLVTGAQPFEVFQQEIEAALASAE